MRRFAAVFLFFSGLIGLVLVLIFWLPKSINLGIVVFVGLLCLGCVWGGGKLLQPSAVFRKKAVPGSFVTQPYGQRQFVAVCPRCGWRISSRQRFCGGCGMAVGSACSQCGAVVIPGSRFCTNCGNKLTEQERV